MTQDEKDITESAMNEAVVNIAAGLAILLIVIALISNI